MTLRSRLERLRRPEAGASIGSTTQPADTLATRLQRMRPVRTVGSPSARPASADGIDVAHLARRLHADFDGELCWMDESHRLPDDDSALHELPFMLAHAGADWVYLDIESTGLSGGVGNLAFMVGAARTDRERRMLHVRQWLIASFAAERCMLESVCDWIGQDGVLVSYNGKSFDVPLLQSRLRLHGIAVALDSLPHLDLVYAVRRLFRRSWPDCRLQTAEQRLLGLARVDDLPGAAAPAAWLDWLRRGEAGALAGVRRHNAQDVVSLRRLHRLLVALHGGQATKDIDHTALGRAWLRSGEEDRARLAWEAAGSDLDVRGQLELAASYRRLGDWRLAEACWMRAFALGSQVAACELSKFHEHRRRDLRRALRFAAHCADDNNGRRLARLARKVVGAPQLDMFVNGSVAEGDDIARAIRGRQAAAELS